MQLMCLEPELRRKLSQLLTPEVVEALRMEMEAEVLANVALEPLHKPEEVELVLTELRGIRYACGFLNQLGINPVQPGGGTGAAGAEWQRSN